SYAEIESEGYDCTAIKPKKVRRRITLKRRVRKTMSDQEIDFPLFQRLTVWQINNVRAKESPLPGQRIDGNTGRRRRSRQVGSGCWTAWSGLLGRRSRSSNGACSGRLSINHLFAGIDGHLFTAGFDNDDLIFRIGEMNGQIFVNLGRGIRKAIGILRP